MSRSSARRARFAVFWPGTLRTVALTAAHAPSDIPMVIAASIQRVPGHAARACLCQTASRGLKRCLYPRHAVRARSSKLVATKAAAAARVARVQQMASLLHFVRVVTTAGLPSFTGALHSERFAHKEALQKLQSLHWFELRNPTRKKEVSVRTSHARAKPRLQPE